MTLCDRPHRHKPSGRSLFHCIVAFWILLCCGTAHAQYSEDNQPIELSKKWSPQHFSLDIKLGPYSPYLDQSSGLPSGATPHSDLFGSSSDAKGARPSPSLLGQVELDYQFSHKYGTWGIGIAMGYARKTASSFVLFDPSATPCKVTGEPGAERSYIHPVSGAVPFDQCINGDANNTLHILPLSLLFVYRFDILDTRYNIPVVPYVRAGLAYNIWWFENENPFVSQHEIGKASPQNSALLSSSGGTWGVVFHPGLAINLGNLDRKAGLDMDRLYGINRFNLFVELNYAWMTGFGKPNQLDVSDIGVLAGLGMEF